MRSSSTTPPPGAFMVENLPGTDKVLIHLYENAEEKTERLYWVYDEYRIEAENTCDVLGNYDALMAQAKLAEAEKADGAFWTWAVTTRPSMTSSNSTTKSRT
jgi:hypothetical protein